MCFLGRNDFFSKFAMGKYDFFRLLLFDGLFCKILFYKFVK